MFKAGTASELITPDEPLWLAGYAARTEPAKGKISDLYASALALEDNQGSHLIIASIDLIAVPKIIADPVYEAVQKQLGLGRDRLILAATHTHYGPEFRPDKQQFFHVPSDYAAKFTATARNVCDALINVIVGASRELHPVKLYR